MDSSLGRAAGFGLYSAGLCLVKGLNQTNMDNRFAFGLWIFSI
jgi:menaquinone reductase, integral membrane subunit